MYILNQIKCVLCRCNVGNIFNIEDQTLWILTKKKTYLLTVFPSIQTEFTRLLSLAAMLPAEQSLVKGSGVRWKMDTFVNEEEFGNKEVLGEGLKVLISFVLITHVKPWLRVSCGGGGGIVWWRGANKREMTLLSAPTPNAARYSSSNYLK